jgi:hypothetical protein
MCGEIIGDFFKQNMSCWENSCHRPPLLPFINGIITFRRGLRTKDS